MIKNLVSILFLFIGTLALGQGRDTVISTRVYYEVSKSRIIDIREYLSDFLPFVSENEEYLTKIKVTSSTSPEGPHALNIKLGEDRNASVARLIDDISCKKEYYAEIENYNGLRELLAGKNEPYADSVIAIMQSGKNVSERIKNACGGRIWRWLLKEYYPKLRSTHIGAYFHWGEVEKAAPDTARLRDTIYIPTIERYIDTVYVEKRPTIKIYPIFAVKTNFVADALITPNVHAELYPWIWGLSAEFEYDFPWFGSTVTHRYYQVSNAFVGIRKYFKNNYNGWYVGVYANNALYDIAINKDNGWQGEGHGLGITAGYLIRKKNFNLEPFIRVGYFNSRFDEYDASQPFNGKYYYKWNGRNSDFVPRRFELNYIGPTMLGITISYDLIKTFRICD